jgi:glycerol-3-phosphate acyltransferase PlsX
LLLVGAPEQLRGLVTDHAVRIVPASLGITAEDDPVRAVRARRGASVRVAARMVRDGEADGFVSFGPPEATIAAARFSLGRLPGATKPSLATVVRAPSRRVVLLDTGAGPEAGPGTLVQYALAGVTYAKARFGVARPTVGLLSAGYPPGSGDPLHDEAHRLLADLPMDDGERVSYAGMVDVHAVVDVNAVVNVNAVVEGNAVVAGGSAVSRRAVASEGAVDVVVTDGFTGKVLVAALPRKLGSEAVLLGVDGVVVVGSGSTPGGVAADVRIAGDVARSGLVAQLRTEMGALRARRRRDHSQGLAP